MGEEPGSQAPPTPDPAQSAPPAPTPTPPPATPPAPAANGKGEEFSAEYVRDLRAEAKRNREKAQQFEQTLEGLRAALGLNPNQPVDPAKVQSELAATRTQLRDLQVTSAVTEIAAELGLKPRLARALVMAEGLANELDPTAPTFRESLKLEIQKVATTNPELRAGPIPPRSGSEMNGPGSESPLTLENVLRMTPEELDKNWPAVSKILETTR